MNMNHTSKTNWSVWVIIAASIPLTVIILGIIGAFMSTRQGVVDTTSERTLFLIGLYFTIPCGILNIILASKGLSKNFVKKKIAIPGIIIGVFSLLIGILSWIWFFMIQAFAAAF